MRTRITAVVVTLVVAFALSGCVSTHMKKFVGKDVRYIEVEDGQPVRVFDMPDGKRAFQYYWGGGRYVVPQTTTTAGEVQLTGQGAYYTEQQVTRGGYVVESEGCLITYFAEWNSEKKGWIVVGIAYPKRLVC